jgi:hypothetical protein
MSFHISHSVSFGFSKRKMCFSGANRLKMPGGRGQGRTGGEFRARSPLQGENGSRSPLPKKKKGSVRPCQGRTGTKVQIEGRTGPNRGANRPVRPCPEKKKGSVRPWISVANRRGAPRRIFTVLSQSRARILSFSGANRGRKKGAGANRANRVL